MDRAYAEELRAHYKKLWVDYKLAVTGAYFSGQTLAGNAPVFSWEGPHGIKAAAAPPLQTYLAAPQLAPELAQHLPNAQAQHAQHVHPLPAAQQPQLQQ